MPELTSWFSLTISPHMLITTVPEYRNFSRAAQLRQLGILKNRSFPKEQKLNLIPEAIRARFVLD
jgi:hypothetical protein